MNGTTESQTATQTVFNGPISLPMTVGVALMLLCLFAWSLYRERFVLGRRIMIGFAMLRLISLVTMLWMLLAPTRVLVETATTPRTIAIITDTSASMTTVDPLGTADEIRWETGTRKRSLDFSKSGRETVAKGVATAFADNALASLGIAARELADGIESVRQHSPDPKIASSIASAQTAIERCLANLDQLRQCPLTLLVGNERSQAIHPVMQNARSLLESPEFQDFQSLAKRLSSGQTPQQPDWQENLRDLQYRTGSTRKVLAELSRLVADAETQTLNNQQIKHQPHHSRLARVAPFLQNLKTITFNSMDDSVKVRWLRFDKTVTTLRNASQVESSPIESSQQDPQSDGASESDASPALATNLSAALESLRSPDGEIPIAAAFVFSDAGHNDTGLTFIDGEAKKTHNDAVSLPTQVAATLGGTPVYMVPIGNVNRLRDVHLVGVDAPTVAMRNDDIVIEAHLEAYQCQGDHCTVELLDGSQVVDFREIQFDSNFASRTVRFQRRVSEIGDTSLSVVVSGVEDEMTRANNLRKIGIHVTRNQIKVLLADEMPRWEFRYLAQLFRRDPKIECDEMLFRPRIIATGSRKSDGVFPVTADEWDEYDVVILGDITPEHLSVASQESLAAYLRHRGGTLVLIAGSRAMPHAFAESPLAGLLPVEKTDVPRVAPDGFAFHATREGRSHVAMMIGETQQATQTAWDFVNKFSPLHAVSPWRRPKAHARNLIAVVPRGSTVNDASEFQDTFMCWQPIGRGRVVYFSGPDTYRLRFLRGDRYHYRFWGQLLRWAIAADLSSGTKRVRLRTNKADYRSGQDVTIEVRLSKKDGAPITDPGDLLLNVTSNDTTEQVSLRPDQEIPGLYLAHLSSPLPGVYAVKPVGGYIDTLPESESDEEIDVSFSVFADLPMELADTRCNRVLAAQISEITGGQVLPPCAVAEVLALTDLTPIVTQTTYQTPLWSQWKYLLLVLGCLQTEWIIRKWRGLS